MWKVWQKIRPRKRSFKIAVREESHQFAVQETALKDLKEPKSRTVKSASQADVLCRSCAEPYCEPLTEDWIQCENYKKWWHEDCTSYEGGVYVCELCFWTDGHFPHTCSHGTETCTITLGHLPQCWGRYPHSECLWTFLIYCALLCILECLTAVSRCRKVHLQFGIVLFFFVI